MSDHNFVLSDQDGVLAGHMSFQVKIIICSPGLWLFKGRIMLHVMQWISADTSTTLPIGK